MSPQHAIPEGNERVTITTEFDLFNMAQPGFEDDEIQWSKDLLFLASFLANFARLDWTPDGAATDVWRKSC